MLYTFADEKRIMASPISLLAAIGVGLLMALSLSPIGTTYIAGIESKLSSTVSSVSSPATLPPAPNYVQVTSALPPQTYDYEINANLENNIIFNEDLAEKPEILVKVKPSISGSYLFSGDLCVAELQTRDGVEKLGQSGDVVSLSNVSSADYSVDCDKAANNENYEFSFLYISPASGLEGIGGSGIDSAQLQNTIRRSGTGVGGSSIQSQPQYINNFSPSNTFSPSTTVINPPPEEEPPAEEDPLMDIIQQILPPLPPILP